jgi:hypothetical protein
VNLETLEVHLVSTLLSETAASLPTALLVLPDDTPLYDEEALLDELAEAATEEREARINIEIVELESFNSTLITVTFRSDLFEDVYRVNIPRQYLQVGRLYNTLLKTPAMIILTESELEGNEGHNTLEALSALYDEDIVLRMFFPAEPTPEQELNFNQVLNHSDVDFMSSEDVERFVNSNTRISITTEPEELSELRTELVDIIISLINGNEDALLSLYEYAEYIDIAGESIKLNTPLNDDERKALIIYEFLTVLYKGTAPGYLVSQIVEDTEIDEINNFQSLIRDSGIELDGIFQNVLKDHFQENPDTIPISSESSHQERVEYLTRNSNTIPLLGGLLTLSDRMNVDLLYSRDWNLETVNQDESISKGEYGIILAFIIAQRIQMFGKVLGDDTAEEMNQLAMSILVSNLTTEDEDENWVIVGALKRLMLTQPLVFNEFMKISVEQDEEVILYGPFGGLLHQLGHLIVDDGWNQESMLIAFDKQPDIKEFVELLFLAHSENPSDEDDEEQDSCFSATATEEFITVHEDELGAVVTQLGEALLIIAELNVMREENFKKDSEEWNSSVQQYLSEIADSLD